MIKLDHFYILLIYELISYTFFDENEGKYVISSSVHVFLHFVLMEPSRDTMSRTVYLHVATALFTNLNHHINHHPFTGDGKYKEDVAEAVNTISNEQELQQH